MSQTVEGYQTKNLMQVAPDPLVSKELLYATEEEAQTASATRLEEVKIYAASRTSRVSQLLPAWASRLVALPDQQIAAMKCLREENGKESRRDLPLCLFNVIRPQFDLRKREHAKIFRKFFLSTSTIEFRTRACKSFGNSQNKPNGNSTTTKHSCKLLWSSDTWNVPLDRNICAQAHDHSSISSNCRRRICNCDGW